MEKFILLNIMIIKFSFSVVFYLNVFISSIKVLPKIMSIVFLAYNKHFSFHICLALIVLLLSNKVLLIIFQLLNVAPKYYYIFKFVIIYKGK